MFDKKLITVLSVIIGVIVIGAVAVVLVDRKTEPVSPNITDNSKVSQELKSNIDTSDWVSYRNEELGIEFLYPNEWKRQDSGFEVTFIIPNLENRPLLDNLGQVKVAVSGATTDSLLDNKKSDFKKPWREELGVDREIPEAQETINGNKISILGPTSPPSRMFRDIFAVVSSDTKRVTISTHIMGGDVDLIIRQVENIYSSIEFFN